MFDRYDLINMYIREHKELKFCTQSECKDSVLQNYTVWCDIKKITDEEFNYSKEKYFKETIEGKGDAVDRILSSNNFGNKKAQIEFLYSNIDFMDECKKIHKEVFYDNIEQKRSKQLELLKTKGIIENILHINFNDDMKKYYHISLVDNSLRMFYFKDLGIFFSVGIDYKLDSKIDINISEINQIFKCLADETRLKIVKHLNKKNLTPVELSKITGVTLSTINHHIKKLCGCNIVNIVLSDKLQKNIKFSLNKQYIINILEVIDNEIQ